MLPKCLLALFVLGACLNAVSVQAASIKLHKFKKNVKTPWELQEALSASSQIRRFNGTWISDNEFYYTAADKSIHLFNVSSNSDSKFVDASFFEQYPGGTSFTLSADNTKILVRYAVEEVFRHSFIAKYDVFDIASGKSVPINKGEKLQFCSWSPKDVLSFVYENNVYLHLNEKLEPKVTNDGIDGVVYNGIPDWIYEEEVLSSGSAMWWSPDGLKLAIGMFDDTKVETFKYFLYGEAEDPQYQYPKEVDLKYPKPGSNNPTVSLRIADINGDLSTVRVNAPVEIVSADHILQNVAWYDNNNFIVTWLNRRQNIGVIQSCTAEGVCRNVKQLQEPNGWIVMKDPICPKNAQKCIFINWIDDWMQVWKLNLENGDNEWSSRGNFTVLQVYGYDEANDKLYYQATRVNDPASYQVYVNDECLSCNLRDVDNELCQTASASFSKDYSYYALTCSGPNPSYSKIFETKSNTEVKDWVSNSDFRAYLAHKQRAEIRFMNVSLADGSLGYAKLQLPPAFDENKKYPLIVYVYGGPNSVRATSGFTVGFDAYMTTKRQVIIAIIDGRGTGNKGKNLLYSVNNNLGQHEVEDQLFVTKYLQDNLKFVDRERTGIWGWSYGGYMTAKTITEDDERIFQCGVSVAPVTSWIYYDTIYTERFMGLPTADDNELKYKSSSVFEKIENFRTHDFLLVHGSGDDNVHYQHSLMLAKVLQTNDIAFEEMTYTDENHSIGNFQPHLYNTMDHFWINCLNLEVDDENEL